MDADVFEEVARQPSAGAFTVRFDNGKLSHLLQFVLENVIYQNTHFVVFSVVPLSLLTCV